MASNRAFGSAQVLNMATDHKPVPPAAFIFSLLAIFVILPVHATADYVLYTGEVLMTGQNLTNGRYRLAMHANCELVLYEDESPIWKAERNRSAVHDCYLGLKCTGELVLRSGIHYTVWSSAARSKKGRYALVLDGDGNLGVYGRKLWGSDNKKDKATISEPAVPPADYVLHSGQLLTPGKKLKYDNFELSLTYCNLVIKDARSGKTLWQTKTPQVSDDDECRAVLNNEGELSIMHGSQRLWSSGHNDDAGAYVGVLRHDGKFHIYGPLLWFSSRNYDVFAPSASTA